MALPLGPILLLAVVGGALFGGLDVRKKNKKNGTPTNGGGGNGSGDQSYDVVACAHVLDVSDNGQQASLDGGPWQSAEKLDDQMWWSIERQRPQVLFTMCYSDPATIQMLEQLCQQNPDIEFYGIYASRLTGTLRTQVEAKCKQEGVIVGFNVFTPTGPDSGRAYLGDEIPELVISSSTDIGNVFANLLAFANGVDHPAAEDFFTE